MAHVTLPPFIQSISGQIGNLRFRTSASGKTTVSAFRPQKRATPVTPSEQAARERFRRIAATVALMRTQGSSLSRKELWTIAAKAYDAANQ